MEIKTVNIGKSGVSDSVIKEMDGLLRKYKTIRIKILRSAKQNIDKSIIADEVSKKTESRLPHQWSLISIVESVVGPLSIPSAKSYINPV